MLVLVRHVERQGAALEELEDEEGDDVEARSAVNRAVWYDDTNMISMGIVLQCNAL